MNHIQASAVIEALSAARTNINPMVDTRALQCCINIFKDRYEDAREATQRRRNHLRDIKVCAQRGKIAIVTSGMDCDCSRWENSVSIVDANIAEVDAWLERFYANAEGPQGHYIECPSTARKLVRSSRDLALEAFENGHPHVVYA